MKRASSKTPEIRWRQSRDPYFISEQIWSYKHFWFRLITDRNVKQQIWVWCINHFMDHSYCSFSKCIKLLHVFSLDLGNKGRIFISLNVSYKGWNQSKPFTLAFSFLSAVAPTLEMLSVNDRKLWVRQHFHLLTSQLRSHFKGNEKEIDQGMLHLLICLFIAYL